MSKKGKILILDGSNLAYRAYHSMKGMRFNGKGSGIPWGFLNILMGLLGKYKPKYVYVCWDSKGSNPIRLGLMPGYRQRDEEKKRIDFDPADFLKQKEGLIEILHCLGIPQLIADHVEADDFIYALQKRAILKTKRKIIIASGDKDFRQLVNDRVSIHDDKKGYITPYNFKKHFGVEPHQYADFLCLLGDKSDKIPGIPGIGEVTATKILSQYVNVIQFMNAQPMDPKAEKIRKGYNLNRCLINLDYFDQTYGPIKLQFYKNQRRPKKNISEYYKKCDIFGINKFKESKYINLVPWL